MYDPSQCYLLRPHFSPLGTRTSNDDVARQLRGSLDPAQALRYMSGTGSAYRYLDYEPVPLVPAATQAVEAVLKLNGIGLDDLNGVIYGSLFRENLEPSTAAFVARELGAPALKTLDISAACSGMAHSVEVAAGWLAFNPDFKHVALVSVDTPYRYIDWELNVKEDLVLKGPGLTLGAAVSALVVSRTEPEFGIRLKHFVSHDDASCAPLCTLPIGGLFHSDSNRLVRPTIESLRKVKQAGLSDEAWVLPHQPNVQVSRFARILKVPQERVIVTHSQYGNTAASAWVSAYHALNQERSAEVSTDDEVLIKTMAGGFSSLGIVGRFINQRGQA